MAEPLPFALLDALAGPEAGQADRVGTAVAAHPAMAEAIEPLGSVLLDATIELELGLQRIDIATTVRGRLGSNGAVIAVPTAQDSEDAWWQVAPLPGLPRLIGRIVGIEPQLHHADQGAFVPMPSDAIHLAVGRSGARETIAPMIDAMVADGYRRDTLEGILSPESLLWQLGLFEAGEVQPFKALAVIDTIDHGYWIVYDTDGGTLLQSVTATGLWRVLCDALDLLPKG